MTSVKNAKNTSIDHLAGIDARGLAQRCGFSRLFDYAVLTIDVSRWTRWFAVRHRYRRGTTHATAQRPVIQLSYGAAVFLSCL